MSSCKHCQALLPGNIILFCPMCGETVTNVEDELEKERVFKRRNVPVQILLASIPIASFLATYRVKRLKTSLEIYVPTIIVCFFVFIRIYSLSTDGNIPYPINIIVLVGIAVTPSLVAIYSVANWTKQWNQKINFITSFQ